MDSFPPETPPETAQFVQRLCHSLKAGIWERSLFEDLKEVCTMPDAELRAWGWRVLATATAALLSCPRFGRQRVVKEMKRFDHEEEKEGFAMALAFIDDALARIWSVRAIKDEKFWRALAAILCSQNQALYDMYSHISEDPYLQNDGISVVRLFSPQHGFYSPFKDTSYYVCPIRLVALHSFVNQLDGLSVLQQILIEGFDANQKPSLPVPILLEAASLMGNVIQGLNPVTISESVAPAYSTAIGTFFGTLKDDDLKTVEKNAFERNVIAPLTESLRRCVGNDEPLPELLTTLIRLRFKIALRYLKVSSIAWKLSGLNDIIEIVTKPPSWLFAKDDTNNPASRKLLRQESARFLVKDQVLQYLFKEGAHPELLRRLGPLLRFLASKNELTLEFFDELWQCSLGQHETIVFSMWTSFADLASALSLEVLNHFLDKLVAVSHSQYNEHFMNLLKSVVEAGLEASPAADRPDYLGLQHVWKLAMEVDNSRPPYSQISGRLCDILAGLLSSPACRHFRIVYLEKCSELLLSRPSLMRALSLMKHLIESFHHEEGGTAKVLSFLMGAQNLLDRVIGLLSQANPLESNEFHHTLDFVSFMLSASDSSLTQQQLDLLWQYAVVDPLPDLRDIGFRFFETARTPSPGFLREPFELSQIEYIFERKLPSLDLSTLSQKGFLLFDFYFRYLNWHWKKFEQVADEFTILAPDLSGLDLLWRIALEVQDRQSGELAVRFLVRLQKNWHPKNAAIVQAEREKFFSRCLTSLAEAGELLIAERTVGRAAAFLKAERCMDIIGLSLEVLEDGVRSKPGHSKGYKSSGRFLRFRVKLMNPPEDAQVELSEGANVEEIRSAVVEKFGPSFRRCRMIFSGKELKDGTLMDNQLVDGIIVHIVPRPNSTAPGSDEPTAAELSPSRILASSQNFDLFFRMLSLPPPLGLRFWELIERLPTSSSFRETLSQLKDTHALALYDQHNVFKLYYSLQVTNTFLNQDGVTEWKQRFFALGGLQHLLKIVLQDDAVLTAGREKWTSCRALLLQVLTSLLLVDDRQEPSRVDSTARSLLVDLASKLVSHLLALIPEFVRSAERSSATEEQLQADEGSVAAAVRLLVALLAEDSATLASPATLSWVSAWINTILLAARSKPIRHACLEGLRILSLASPAFHGGVLAELYRSFPSVVDPASRERMTLHSWEYWLLFHQLLTVEPAIEVPFPLDGLLGRLLLAIKDHPIVEATAESSSDAQLCGLLTLVRSVALRVPRLEPAVARDLVAETIGTCLFRTPHLEDAPVDGLYPPKCKTAQSRTAAFSVVDALVGRAPEQMGLLGEDLATLLRDLEWKSNWSFKPDVADRDPHLYAGLKNLGATCYMNSLLQQLFLLPQLRHSLLTAPVTAKEGTSSILYQVQSLFATLQETSKKWHDARGLASIYKVDGQPIRLSEQMDADEFYRGLLDKLEFDLKGTEQAKLLDTYFRGAITYQTICQECRVPSERNETFYNLAVEVKDKTTLDESLAALVQADRLDGDNKYNCERCNKKVAALRRATIGELPPVLVVHLKRFEFDLETLHRTKLNSFLSFPHDLNVEPYTKEGLSRRDAQPQGAEAPPAPPIGYRLTGVVVHTGSVDSGHYYSFIEDPDPSRRGQWFQFNDRHVTPFDPRHLSEECFGGVMHAPYFDPQKRQHVQRQILRPNNAYMLFYQRIRPEEQLPDALSPATRRRSVPHPLLQSIWESNVDSARERLIFDPACTSFLLSLLRRLSTEPPTFPPPPLYQAALLAFFKVITHAADKPPFLPELAQSLIRLVAQPALARAALEVLGTKEAIRHYIYGSGDPGFTSALIDVLVRAAEVAAADSTFFATATPLDLLAGPDHLVSSDPLVAFQHTLVRMLADAIEQPSRALFTLVHMQLSQSPPLRRYWASTGGVRVVMEVVESRSKLNKADDAKWALSVTPLVDALALLAVTPGLPAEDQERLLSESTLYQVLRTDGAAEVARMAVELCRDNGATSDRFTHALAYGINKDNADAFEPYFIVMRALLALDDPAQSVRTEQLLVRFLESVERNQQYPVATSTALAFLLQVAHRAHVTDRIIALAPRLVPYLIYRVPTSNGAAERVRYTVEALILGLTRLPDHAPIHEGTRTYVVDPLPPPASQAPPELWLTELLPLLTDPERLLALAMPEPYRKASDDQGLLTLRSLWRTLRTIVLTPEQAAQLLSMVPGMLLALTIRPRPPPHDLARPLLLDLLHHLATLHPAFLTRLTEEDALSAIVNQPLSVYDEPDSKAYHALLLPPLFRLWTLLAGRVPQAVVRAPALPVLIDYLIMRPGHEGAHLIEGVTRTQIETQHLRPLLRLLVAAVPHHAAHFFETLMERVAGPVSEPLFDRLHGYVDLTLHNAPATWALLLKSRGLLHLLQSVHVPFLRPRILRLVRQGLEWLTLNGGLEALDTSDLVPPLLLVLGPSSPLPPSHDMADLLAIASHLLSSHPALLDPLALHLRARLVAVGLLDSGGALTALRLPAEAEPVPPWLQLLARIPPAHQSAAATLAAYVALLGAAQGHDRALTTLHATRVWLHQPAEAVAPFAAAALLFVAYLPEEERTTEAPLLLSLRAQLDGVVHHELLVATLSSLMATAEPDPALLLADVRAMLWLDDAPRIPAPLLEALRPLLASTPELLARLIPI